MIDLRVSASSWQRAGLGGLLMLAVVAMAPGGYSQTVRQTVPPAPAVQPASATTSAAASPLDEPIRLGHKARDTYQQHVRDYSCIMVKRELLQGKLQPENLIAMKLRNQPFSVHLRWLGPKNLEGQEGCYVAGKNKNMMRVKSNGVLGAVGFVSLDLKDPRVAANSRHSITDAGIGNLIGRLYKGWEEERIAGRHTLVSVADYEFAKRPCTRVEICRPNSQPGQFYAYRIVVYFDKENHLPIRTENYGWPHEGGTPGGDLMESFSYVNLKFNNNFTDQDFNK